MKISRQLSLISLVVLVLLALNAAITIILVQRMLGNAQQLVIVGESLDEAQMEMEINLGESARAILHYITSPEKADIERMRDSVQDFERNAREFDRLAEDPEIRALGRAVAEIFQEMQALSIEMTSMTGQRNESLLAFHKIAAEADELVDGKIQALVEHGSLATLNRIEAMLRMENDIDTARSAIDGYVLAPDLKFKQAVDELESHFKRIESQFRGTYLSASDKEWLDELDKDFAEMLTAAYRTITITDRLHDDLKKFEAYLNEGDRLLDEEIQVTIMEDVVRDQQNLQRSGEIAIYSVVTVGILIFAIVFWVGRVLSRGIITATDRLSEGAAQFARGNLDHHIEARSADELGVLSSAFNEMANRLKRADHQRINLERQVQHSQKLESLGILAGGIAHDFNNILMAIHGFTELALDDISPDSPARGSLLEITTATKRAAALTGQMLAYSGKGSFVKTRIDLSEVVRQISHLLQSSISQNVTLLSDLGTGLPPIKADEAQIQQVIMNFITNAADAIEEKGPLDGANAVIRISTGVKEFDSAFLSGNYLPEEPEKGKYVFLQVSDTGSGMDGKTRAKVFDPFFSTKFAGRGLGMASVLGIIRGHDGAIMIDSNPGQGTTFTALFPPTDGTADRSM